VVEIAAVPGALAQVREAARLANAGRLGEAAAAYQKLLDATPDLPDCWYELGRLQRRLRRFDAALESYAQALRRGVARPEEVHLNRGVIFADCLRQDAAAEGELRTALALNPAYLPALQNLANLHEDLGRREEAQAAYERILTLDTNAFEALARYGQLADIQLPHDPLIARLRAALAHPAADAAAQASLGFALARRLDAAGEYGAAFAAAVAANRASRASVTPPVRYDRSGHERFVDALIAAFAHPRTLPARVAAAADPRPIFVCGMYRSGSTLAERLLGAHPQVVAGGELDLLPHLVQSALAPFPSRIAATSDETLTTVAADYIQGLRQLFPGAQSVTDKRPDNFLLIGLIKTLFPGAKIVHTTRDALDTCLSIFFLHLDPRVPWALELMDIGHYFRQYQRLMAHWRSLYGEDILDFNYDELVHDPRPQAERLLGFCGLGWSESCLDFTRARGAVKSASVWQVREALYQRASGRARHYAGELGTLGAYLADSGGER
jgi:Sulfotransferase family/Tetratricopeptide repeat